MRTVRIAVLALLLITVFHSESPADLANVAGNTLANTLMLRTSNGQGTGFTVNIDGRQSLLSG